MTAKPRLGRGLDALLKDGARSEHAPQPEQPLASGIAMRNVPLKDIRPNPRQPRRIFEPAALEELAQSIREHGIIQPLVVRKTESGFELIAGERRFLAARQAGLLDAPVTIREISDQGSLELALIENLQREDINAIEEAEGYKVLAEQFSLTHEQIAGRVGKSRAAISNSLRLLTLPDEARRLLAEGRIEPGHAKVLVGLEIDPEKIALAQRVARQGLSVRDLEAIVARMRRTARKPRVTRSDIPQPQMEFISDKLRRHFGTGVTLKPSKTLANGRKVKGMLEIEFYSNDDLNRVLDAMGIVLE